MVSIGIIANPAAGKDIRRLVAQATTFDNNEKVNIVRRILLGIQAAGRADVWLMPDYYGIAMRAMRGLELTIACAILDMDPEFTQADSTRAAALLCEQGVGCIVTLGGDGTNRAVAKGCGAVPLIPLSTGTNNVFPQMIEGTIAGLAARVVASGNISLDGVVRPSLCLEVLRNGQVSDIALVDVVASAERFVGARAIWSEDSVRQIISTCARPDTIGFSAVGAYLGMAHMGPHEGLALDIGDGGQQVIAPIAPGLVRPLRVQASRMLAVGDIVPIGMTPAVLALDGEREIAIPLGEAVQVRLSDAGPRVVNVHEVLRRAASQGLFVTDRL